MTHGNVGTLQGWDKTVIISREADMRSRSCAVALSCCAFLGLFAWQWCGPSEVSVAVGLCVACHQDAFSGMGLRVGWGQK